MGYRKETIDWLEKRSDRNILLFYQNRLQDLSTPKKIELRQKGYLSRSVENRRLEFTERGEKLLEEEVIPPYPL